MSYPVTRLRRLRGSDAMRKLVRETRLSPENFILPLFVKPGEGVREPIASMPGQYRYSPDTVLEPCAEAVKLGVPGVLLFGLPDEKALDGAPAWDPAGPVPQAIRAIKSAHLDLLVMTDVCLCAYTDHGHCGVVQDGVICNDETLPLLAKMACAHATAGADVVAPSDMMDGRIAVMRSALDEAGFNDRAICSYAVKYASAYYGPFRDAAGSAPSFGDRRTHQMDPANLREAIREAKADLEEGADILMVKPALAYLDVIRAVREATDAPLACYNVSGEYSMIKAATEKGWADERAVVLESLTAMRRAGADILITYHALDAARWLGA